MKPDKTASLGRIHHILQAVRDIQSFSSGMTYKEFKKDSKTYYACLYQFAVIGEAIVHIDASLLENYEYPWYKVRSFRNFIMHEYNAIDEKVVWDTIVEVLPAFGTIMKQILEDELNGESPFL